MKVINDIIADISEFDRECARHEHADTDEVWNLLHSIKGRLGRAQNEWILYFTLDGICMSAKVQAVNELDACSVVIKMFPERSVYITSSAKTHAVKVGERV